MDTEHAQFRTKLAEAFLTPEELAIWDKILPAVAAEYIQHLLDAVEQEPELLRYLTDNLKAKAEALKNQDIAAWKTALDQELAIIKLVNPSIGS